MFYEALPFITSYICALTKELQRRCSTHSLSNTQQIWLGFCLTALLLTNSLCWAAFERMGLGTYKIGALSWMFRHSKIAWSELLQASVGLLLRLTNCLHGTLVLDDSDHQRAKQTSRIFGVHKVFDKKTGGYFNGQCLMFLVLVTDKLPFQLASSFTDQTPSYALGKKKISALKKQG